MTHNKEQLIPYTPWEIKTQQGKINTYAKWKRIMNLQHIHNQIRNNREKRSKELTKCQQAKTTQQIHNKQ